MTKKLTHPAEYEFAFKQGGQDFTLSNYNVPIKSDKKFAKEV
jgi:hypothetical protein